MATASRTFRAEATPMNAQALGATAESYSSDVNLKTDGYFGSHVTASVTFHASGTKNVRISVYGSLDGTNYDGVAMFAQEVAVSAGNSIQISFIVQDVAHFRIGARHISSESNAATVTVKELAWKFEIV